MKKHGVLWWLCIGWWWVVIKWVFSVLAESESTQSGAQKPSGEKREPYVYITTKGKKYHYDILCPALRNAKEIKMDLSKARKAGYTACDKCCYNYLHEKDWEG